MKTTEGISSPLTSARRPIAIAVFLGIVTFFSWNSSVAFADVLIDDFERTNAPAPWTFYNGAEFPGARGSLTSGVGYVGQGAHLAYDLSRGGNYVSAELDLSVPLSAAAISFWVKSPTNITVILRVNDASGQTLQFSLARPLADLSPSDWYQQAVLLNSADGWWGGANDGQCHLPINHLSICAGDPLQGAPIGAVDFDQVSVSAATTFDLDPAQAALVPAPVGSGLILPRLGVNIHFTSDDLALDTARSAGLTGVRMDLIWSDVETVRGQYNWTAYDGLLKSLDSRRMKALLILDYGNPLYTGADNLPPTNTAAIQAFANFAAAAARHFAGRGVEFEIWNEPNVSRFWPPAADPVQYAAMARPAVSQLHQADPQASVVTGGLSGFDFDFADTCRANNGGLGAQAVGVHPYDCDPPEQLSDRLVFLRALAARYFSNAPPVWDTEWGISSSSFGDGHASASRRRQAVLVCRELLSASAVGFPLIIYYDLRDDGPDPTDPEQNYGLLANDYSDKPAMQAVRTLCGIASTRRLSGFVESGIPGVTAMRFDGRTNLIVAIWPGRAGAQVTVTVPTNTTATDFLGAPLALSNRTNRLAWTPKETSGPVYFSYPSTWQATNLAPILTPIPPSEVVAGATLVITNSAYYNEAPSNTLAYSLLSPPVGASVDPSTGLFQWRPLLTQGNSTNTIGIVVRDGGVPSLSATQWVTIVVSKPALQPDASDVPMPVWSIAALATILGAVGSKYLNSQRNRVEPE